MMMIISFTRKGVTSPVKGIPGRLAINELSALANNSRGAFYMGQHVCILNRTQRPSSVHNFQGWLNGRDRDVSCHQDSGRYSLKRKARSDVTRNGNVVVRTRPQTRTLYVIIRWENSINGEMHYGQSRNEKQMSEMTLMRCNEALWSERLWLWQAYHTPGAEIFRGTSGRTVRSGEYTKNIATHRKEIQATHRYYESPPFHMNRNGEPRKRPRLQDSISRHDGLMDLPMSYLWLRSGLNYRMTYSNGSGCMTIPLHSQGPYLWTRRMTS